MSTVSDAERHRLHRKCEELMGEDDANTLFELLPPSGWADVARTSDLHHLESGMEGRFARIDERFARIDERFARIEERFDRQDERFDLKLVALEIRLEGSIARVETALYKEMRDQYNRFLLTMIAVTAFVSTLVEVLGRVLLD